MKRTEIEVGVEYAMHGPMAFGKVPGGTPAKVRFVSKAPNMRVLCEGTAEEYRYTSYADGRQIVRLIPADETRRHATIDEYAGLPITNHEATAGAKVGDRIQWANSAAPGALPAEKWDYRDNQWHPVMVTPASVHMTWAEWVASQEEAEADRRHKKIASAPHDMRKALSDVMDAARRLGLTQQEVALMVSDNGQLKQREDGAWYVEV